MSYTPTNWASTDVVTASRMNALEQAVGDIDMSYTPNVWQDGDVLTASKMNALEQAVASGGGGDSDFSTAEVTFSGMWPQTTIFIGIVENRGISAVLPMGTQTLVLYNGSQVIPNIATDGTVTATGDIEVSIEEGMDYPTVTISGDGTLSIA